MLAAKKLSAEKMNIWPRSKASRANRELSNDDDDGAEDDA